MPDVAGDTFRFLLLVGVFLVALLVGVACVLLLRVKRGLRDLAPETDTPVRGTQETWQEAAAATEESEWQARAIRSMADSPVGPGVHEGELGTDEGPYERDGRWWFRRGGELYAYDGGTGQWVRAQEEPDEPPGVADAASHAPIPEQRAEGERAEADAAPAQSGFWRCAVCSAVNASSARTCRMCFAARP